MKKTLLLFFFLQSFNCFSQDNLTQREKDSLNALIYYRPSVYLKKAGNLGMASIITPIAGGLTSIWLSKNTELVNPEYLSYGSGLASGILLFCCFRNLKLAGLSIQERNNKVKLTLNSTGVKICYQF